MDVQNLFEHIKFISEEAAQILRETVPYGPDILSLTMEDLNELLPGECNFQLRRQIMGLIGVFLQAQAGQSMDSIPADVMSLTPEVPQSKDHSTESDKKQQQMAPQDTNEANIIDDKNLPGMDTDPAGEENESDSMMTLPATEDSSGPSAGLALEVLQSNVDHISVDTEEKPMAAQDGKRSHITNDSEHYADSQAEIPQSSVTCTQQDTEQQPMATKNVKMLNITKDSELHRGGTKPVDEGSESEQRMTVPAMEHSTGHSGVISRLCQTFRMMRNYSFVEVEVHVLIAGEIFYTHETFMQKQNLQIELCSAENCDVILVFCRVVSRITTEYGCSNGQSYRRQTCHPGVHAPLSQPQSHDQHHSATIQGQHSASRPLRLP